MSGNTPDCGLGYAVRDEHKQGSPYKVTLDGGEDYSDLPMLSPVDDEMGPGDMEAGSTGAEPPVSNPAARAACTRASMVAMMRGIACPPVPIDRASTERTQPRRLMVW